MKKLIADSGLENKLKGKNFWQKTKDLYFDPKLIEKWENGRLYEIFGIRYAEKFFRKLGKITNKDFYEKPDSPNNYRIWDKTKEGLKSFERKTRINELIHSPLQILIGYEIINNLAKENYALATLDTLFGLINGYAIMLQRYNRTRIYKVLEKKNN